MRGQRSGCPPCRFLLVGVLLLALVVPTSAGSRAAADASDPLRDLQWGLDQVRIDAAWEVTRGADVVVAVVDSGVQAGHEDLADNVLWGNTFSNCGDDGCGDGDWAIHNDRTLDGHGTHVAGIVAARQGNGVGIAGVAPDADILPVRVNFEDLSSQISDLARGIRWAADHGADVMNLSFGTPVGAVNVPFPIVNSALAGAVDYAVDRGLLVVSSAGNEFSPLCDQPSNQPGVLCVVATDRNERRAEYSSGPLDQGLTAVAAPGGALLGCEPGVLSTVPPTWVGCLQEDGYAFTSGTSMAAPHVAGVGALVRSLGCGAAEAIDIITTTAREPVTGERGVFTPTHGWGIVDADAAVAAAQQRCMPDPDNRPPVAPDRSITTTEGVPVQIDLLGAVSDPDGDPVELRALTRPSSGSLTLHGDGTVTYAPGPFFDGSDGFAYRVRDARFGHATGTVAINVTPVAHAPLARDDFAVVAPGTANDIHVLANDDDSKGFPLVIEAVAQPLHGAATTDGRIVTYHAPAEVVPDAFTYTIGNGTGLTATATVHVFAEGCLSDWHDDLEPVPQPGWTTQTARNFTIVSPTWGHRRDPFASSPDHSFHSDAAVAGLKDDRLVAPPQLLSDRSELRFQHRFALDEQFDGGVLEFSLDGGETWEDVGPDRFLAGGYTGVVAGSFIPGRPAWTGASDAAPDGMTEVRVDLSDLAGREVQVRWRLTVVPLVPQNSQSLGWWLDDITFTATIGDGCLLPG